MSFSNQITFLSICFFSISLSKEVKVKHIPAMPVFTLSDQSFELWLWYLDWPKQIQCWYHMTASCLTAPEPTHSGRFDHQDAVEKHAQHESSKPHLLLSMLLYDSFNFLLMCPPNVLMARLLLHGKLSIFWRLFSLKSERLMFMLCCFSVKAQNFACL